MAPAMIAARELDIRTVDTISVKSYDHQDQSEARILKSPDPGLMGDGTGILIVDGWHAYTKIVCDRQTCMAHIFRKIRAFIDAFPQYRSIMKFYLKLRRIIRDGEKL